MSHDLVERLINGVHFKINFRKCVSVVYFVSSSLWMEMEITHCVKVEQTNDFTLCQSRTNQWLHFVSKSNKPMTSFCVEVERRNQWLLFTNDFTLCRSRTNQRLHFVSKSNRPMTSLWSSWLFKLLIENQSITSSYPWKGIRGIEVHLYISQLHTCKC